MEQPLFRKSTISFEKTAATTALEEEPEEWPAEILKHAYKQLPWMYNTENEVELERVDSSRGYAVGRVLIFPAKMTKEAAADEKKLIAIPIIVREREMAPLDIYMHEKQAFPVDDEEIQGILFRPTLFLGPARKGQFGPATSLAAQTKPPSADQRYMGGALSKTSGARPSLLKAASVGFHDQDLQAFRERLKNDGPLRQACLNNDAMHRATLTLLNSREKTASELEAYRHASTKPTVIQLVKTATAYKARYANHACFNIQEQALNPHEARQAVSLPQNWEALQKRGSVTFVIDPVVRDQVIEKRAEVAGSLGIYDVWLGGKQVRGVVIPKSVTLDEKPLGLAVYSSPEGHALQEKIAGVRVENVTLPRTTPGTGEVGVFVYQEGPLAFATEPLKIRGRSSIAGEDGVKTSSVHVERLSTGTRALLTFVEGIQKIASLGDHDYIIPSTFKWLPLRGKHTAVPESVEDAQEREAIKVASSSSTELISDGATYMLRGENVLAFKDQMLSPIDAEFALGALGLTYEQSVNLMKTADERGSARAVHTRKVQLEGDVKIRELLKVASIHRSLPNLRVDLVKEASVITDKETADAILSLGFMTPENVSVYVDYLPDLEKVSSKLAEILLASRLGMDDVREVAAKNAMTQLNTVIRGLQGLEAKIH